MKVAEKIAEKIAEMPDGNTFKYDELPINREEYMAATKAIERLIKNGIIIRASTGLFYKPKKTLFGILKPNEQELLKPYLFAHNKRIAYVTGTALYNRLGLTTQVPKNIKIASRDKRYELQIGDLKVSSVKSYVEIDDLNYSYLEILDAIKDFRIIPDMNKDSAIKLLKMHVKNLNDKNLLVTLAVNYPPRVRAMVGALVELTEPGMDLKMIKENLNPLSEFNFGLNEQQLPNLNNWKIF